MCKVVKSISFWQFSGVPKGSRTPVSGVRGRRPRPLDDGDAVGAEIAAGRRHVKGPSAIRMRNTAAAPEFQSSTGFKPVCLVASQDMITRFVATVGTIPT